MWPWKLKQDLYFMLLVGVMGGGEWGHIVKSSMPFNLLSGIYRLGRVCSF